MERHGLSMRDNVSLMWYGILEKKLELSSRRIKKKLTVHACTS